MAFSLKPRLSGENSIIMAAAAAGLVIAIFANKIGPVADVHQTGSRDGNLGAAIRKAEWTSIIAVAALTLLAGDPNLAIIGGGTVIIEQLNYRHAWMANEANGQIQVTPQSYAPAAAPPQAGLSTANSGTSGLVEAAAG
jgi:hypothetical protein